MRYLGLFLLLLTLTACATTPVRLPIPPARQAALQRAADACYKDGVTVGRHRVNEYGQVTVTHARADHALAIKELRVLRACIDTKIPAVVPATPKKRPVVAHWIG